MLLFDLIYSVFFNAFNYILEANFVLTSAVKCIIIVVVCYNNNNKIMNLFLYLFSVLFLLEDKRSCL